MNVFQRLFTNSVLSFLSTLIVKASNVIIFILIARESGAYEAGVFSLSTSYLLLLTSLSWGFDELLVRQVAQDHSVANIYFRNFLVGRILFSALLYLGMLFVVFVIMNYSAQTTQLILLINLCLFTDVLSATSQSLLIAFERYVPYFLTSLLSFCIRLLGIFIYINIYKSILLIGGFWLFSSLISATALTILALFQIKGLPRQNFNNFIREFRERQFSVGAVFIAIGVLSSLEYQIDTILLSGFGSEEQVAWYSSVTTVLFSLSLLSQSYRQAIYPLMANYSKNNPGMLQKLYTQSIDLLYTISLPIAVGITFLAPQIISLVFGSSFSPAAFYLQVGIWSLIFLFLNVPNTRLLFVRDGQKQNLILISISMSLNFVSNLILIPHLAVMGAVISRLLSVVVYFGLGILFVSKKQKIDYSFFWPVFYKSLLAILLMVSVLWLLRDRSVFVLIFAGIISYFFGMMTLRAKDFRKIREVFSIKRG